MNLRSIANQLTQVVNPNTPGCTWRQNTGYAPDPTRPSKQMPSYTDVAGVTLQIQAQPSADDLKQLDGLNVQGVTRVIYMNGNALGVVRRDAKGGDILVFPQSPTSAQQEWTVVGVLETWPDWCRVVACLQ